MTGAKGFYDSMYGRISSGWEVENGVLTYTTSVPANTTATLYLPASSVKAIKEGGKPIKKSRDVTFVKYESGRAIYQLKSGDYVFTSTL